MFQGSAKILHLRRSNPVYPNTQGSIWTESGMAGKNLEVLMENKLNTSQKYTCAAKKPTSWVALASGLVEAVPCLHSALVRPHLDHCVQFWPPWMQDRYRHTRARPVKEIKLLEGFSYERQNELQLFNLEKRTIMEDLCVCKYLMGGCRESEPDPPQ